MPHCGDEVTKKVSTKRVKGVMVYSITLLKTIFFGLSSLVSVEETPENGEAWNKMNVREFCNKLNL